MESSSDTTGDGPVTGEEQDRGCGGRRGGFDPAEAARDARADEDPVATVVTQLAGYASSCWDNLAGAGVFESEKASAAVDATLAWLSEQQGRTVKVDADERLVLRLTDAVDDLPDLIKNIGEAVERGHVLLVAPEVEAFVVAADNPVVADSVLGRELIDMVPTSRCAEHVDQAPAQPHAHMEDAGTAAAVCR